MEQHERELLNIDNYVLFLQNNYSLFLPQILLQNTRYRIYNVIADFDDVGGFAIRYKVEDLKIHFSTRGGMSLDYNLVQACYDRWHEPMF